MTVAEAGSSFPERPNWSQFVTDHFRLPRFVTLRFVDDRPETPSPEDLAAIEARLRHFKFLPEEGAVGVVASTNDPRAGDILEMPYQHWNEEAPYERINHAGTQPFTYFPEVPGADDAPEGGPVTAYGTVADIAETGLIYTPKRPQWPLQSDELQ